MAGGVTFDLLFATFFAGLLGFLICSRDLPVIPSVAVALVKVAIPAVYFAFFFNGTWTFFDDKTYLAHGKEMLKDGINPITALSTPEGISELTERKSQHFLYDWWNLLGEQLFGTHYYAPVFLNVVLTFVGGYFLIRMARMAGFGEGYARGLLVFFLLHWDLLAWSSLVNLKDISVMTLTIAVFYFVLKLSKGAIAWSLLALATIFFVFTGIRIYVPLLMVIAMFAWAVLYVPGRRKYAIIAAAVVGIGVVVGVLITIGIVGLSFIPVNLSKLDFGSIVPGTVRMTLTPRPWAINPAYSFLLLPSVLHWVLLVPTIVGGWLLWRRSSEAALLIIYLLGILLLYGAFPDQQGPRYRVQVTFVVAWMQFHFFWVVLRAGAEYISSRWADGNTRVAKAR